MSLVKKINICIIANEPTPYNVDLFNAFASFKDINLNVIHTTKKIWTSSHDFRELPEVNYRVQINSGKGISGKLKASLNVVKAVSRPKQIVIVAGYMSLPCFTAIISCIISRIPFALWTDQFNVGNPKGTAFIKKPLRDLLRYVIFKTAFAVLVAGEPGLKSALQIGGPPELLIKFPYTIDPERFKKNYDTSLPIVKEVVSRAQNRTIIFYSGRFILRKGLDILLKAVNALKEDNIQVFLIIEGEGLLKEQYKRQSIQLNIIKNCHFVGFTQMREHATLVAISDIIVVPSYYDPWGLVVHEGMLAAKPVIASDQVGSALDRIRHGVNGFIFKAGDYRLLAEYLSILIKDQSLRESIGKIAKIDAEVWTPKRNVEAFLSKIK